MPAASIITRSGWWSARRAWSLPDVERMAVLTLPIDGR
jgi:hypothetical protein